MPTHSYMSFPGAGLLRKAAFPLLQKRWYPRSGEYGRELQSVEFTDAATLRERQQHKLRAMLHHAATTTPYYRELFANCGIRLRIDPFETLNRIPILTRSLLNENREHMVSESVDRASLIRNSSGGSTGEPVHLYQDTTYQEYAHASQAFVERWWGVKPGARTASFWGADRDLATLDWKSRLVTDVCQVRTCNAFTMSEPELRAFLEMLAGWKPEYVVGYASALALVAQFLSRHPEIAIQPIALKTTAEALSPSQRVTIEQGFHAPLYDFYGSREVNNLAAECKEHSGLHVNSLFRCVEILDSDDRPCPPGTPGRIIVTDLTNFAMPMLRYENGDIAMWSESACACGRPFPLLQSILGRQSDFITVPSGKLIHGEFFTHIFYDFPKVRQFRLEQLTVTEVRVEIVVEAGAETSALLAAVAERVRAVLEGAHIEVVAVDEIPRTSTGKFRFTTSRVVPQWVGNVSAHLPEVAVKADQPG